MVISSNEHYIADSILVCVMDLLDGVKVTNTGLAMRGVNGW